MWEIISAVLMPIAVYVLMPTLVLGWAVCMFEPGWKFLALWRDSQLPIMKVQPQDAPNMALAGDPAEKQALQDAISLLVNAEGSAQRVGVVTPRGARDFTFLLVYGVAFAVGLVVMTIGSTLQGMVSTRDMEQLAEIVFLSGVVTIMGSVTGVFTGLFGMVATIPGLVDAEDSLLPLINCTRLLTEAQNVLIEAKIEIDGDLTYEVPTILDPSQPIYHSNKGLWWATAIAPRCLQSAIRIMRLSSQKTEIINAARDLRMAAEEVYEKLEKPAPVVKTPLAERIPMVA